MRLKSDFVVLMVLGYSVILAGCGSSNGGGTIDFNTVRASASVDAAKNPLLSDLATWTGTPCDPTATATIKNDQVNFTITSTSSISSGTISPLVLQKATITFTPADSLSPVLPAQFATTFQNLVGTIVPAGGSLSVPVEIVTHNLKEFFFPTAVCTGVPVYTYNVQVIFDAVESGTGKSGSIPAGMTVRIADFSDK
jgi:hypothetical protein